MLKSTIFQNRYKQIDFSKQWTLCILHGFLTLHLQSMQVAELKLSIDGLEKERDFYFGKLRDIEVLCQEEGENAPIVSKIIDILYATEVRFKMFLHVQNNVDFVQYICKIHSSTQM